MADSKPMSSDEIMDIDDFISGNSPSHRLRYITFCHFL